MKMALYWIFMLLVWSLLFSLAIYTCIFVTKRVLKQLMSYNVHT